MPSPRHSFKAAGRSSLNEELRCPKCRESMDAVVVDDVEVDRCARCGGLWFDAGELDWLAQDEIAEAVDVGEAEDGQSMNELTEIDCPRCGRPMKHVADSHKPEIRYEVCPGCEGAFLDAGEFRELSKVSLLEVLQGLMRRRRS